MDEIDEIEVLDFECPHCMGSIIIFKDDINCAIFRHGIHKNGEQVNPHAPKEECDRLVLEDSVLGCCKPFRMEQETDSSGNAVYKIEACDYV